jgi:hypothetical protein
MDCDRDGALYLLVKQSSRGPRSAPAAAEDTDHTIDHDAQLARYALWM